MQSKTLALAGLFALATLAHADKDAFEGWTPQQLKVKVLQLQKENKELKDKMSSAPAKAANVTASAVATTVVDDFEADQAKNGLSWWTGCDDDKLGTVLTPNPFTAEKGGSPVTPGHSGRIKGKLGAHSDGGKWPWASLALALDKQDLSGYSAVSFYTKGDGKKYNFQLCRTSVKDFCHYQAEFMTGKEWAKVTIKIGELAQPSWGAAVPAKFDDVEKIQFNPSTADTAFDFSIDDVTLVK